MPNRIFDLTTKKFGPAVFVALLSGLIAACSDSSRLNQPLFTGSTDNQRTIINDEQNQTMPPALHVDGEEVTRAPLPPPSELAANSATHAPALEVEGPYTWSAVGGTVITVGPGENLNSLATKYGVPTQQILSANQFTRPDQITPGGILVIPHKVPISPDSISPASAKPTQAAAPPPNTAKPEIQTVNTAPQPQTSQPAAGPDKVPETYVVKSGDTLYSIARRYGLRVSELTYLNKLGPSAKIQVGQRLALTPIGGTGAAGTSLATAKPVPATLQPSASRPAAQVASVDPASIPVAQPASLTAAPTAPVETATAALATTDAGQPANHEPASADGKSFRWPVRGQNHFRVWFQGRRRAQ